MEETLSLRGESEQGAVLVHSYVAPPLKPDDLIRTNVALYVRLFEESWDGT